MAANGSGNETVTKHPECRSRVNLQRVSGVHGLRKMLESYLRKPKAAEQEKTKNAVQVKPVERQGAHAPVHVEETSADSDMSTLVGDQDDQGSIWDVENKAGAEAEVDVDLEQLVLLEGSSWADEVSELSDATPQCKELWSTVVGKNEHKLASMRRQDDTKNHQNGSSDFVIPHTNSSITPKMRGRGGASVCGGNHGSHGQYPDLFGQELQYKSLIEPVFLVYNRVSSGSSGPQRVTLMQIACAVVEALNDSTAVDAVQLMKLGWWIYVQTNADQERLIVQGITVASKHVPLQSEFCTTRKKSVKITI